MKNESPFEINEQTMPVIRQMAEHMPGGFFIYHADGDEEFILINKAMLRLTGCETQQQFKELTHNSFRHFVHPDDIHETEASILEQIEKDEYDNDYVEYRIRCWDGAEKWIRDYGHAAHTKIYGDVFYVFVNDATDQHKRELALQAALEDQEAQLQQIMALNAQLKAAKDSSANTHHSM